MFTITLNVLEMFSFSYSLWRSYCGVCICDIVLFHLLNCYMELENIVANTVYIKAKESKYSSILSKTVKKLHFYNLL